ncbi:MAG: DNA polymerase I [Alphaproteobacteria bacterium]
MTKDTLYLIDGSGFIFRAYFAIKRDMTNPKGVPVKAVYGFLTMIQKLMDGNGCGYAAVIFDAGRKTFRNDIYPAYKANRPPAPDDLVPQFALVREAAEALNLPSIELTDYEADDIIATYAMQAKAKGMEVVIVSSDKDLMQLIQPHICLYDAMKEKDICEPEVLEKFGVSPDKVLDVLSLMGDSSDNVPGVPGIGPKTAAELINQFGDLETLLARAGEIKQDKRRETLVQNADKARLSKQLITLKHDVPNLPPLESLVIREPDPAKLMAFMQEHGFKSLANRLQENNAKPPVVPSSPETRSPKPEAFYSIVRDEATLIQWIEKACKKGAVAFDTETTSLNAMQAEMVGFSLCVDVGEACYVPLLHKASGSGLQVSGIALDLFSLKSETCSLEPDQIPLPRAIQLLKPLLEDEAVLKIGHNIKYDWLIMNHYGIEINPIEDTMLLSYVLHAGEHGQGMDELAEKYLQYKTIRFSDVTGTGKNRLRFDEVEIEKAAQYAAEDADITLRLYEVFKPQVIQQRMLTLYETIERPLVPVLAHMERAGIMVDTAKLRGLSNDFALRMRDYEQEVYKLAGHPFNIASPKQLGEVLFDEMNIEGGKKSAKSGAYGTDSSVLEELAEQGHTIAEKVLLWRQLAKLKSTYSDSLPEQINPKTGRIHTSYAMAIASTGRLSSTDPNLQNIPIRTVEGQKIREAFIAKEGCVLVSADYSQIELRLLAHMANIDVLKNAFKHGDDIHAITASQMFGVPVNAVDSDLRRKAKTINFGIIYGISAHGLAARLGISRSEAATYIEQYFRQYPGINDYMEASIAFARKHGYVETLYGRRCHVPAINDKNGARRQFSERAAINAPLQGTAADIIKRAMVAIDRLQASGFRHQKDTTSNLNPEARNLTPVTMLLQVHDELVFEVPEAHVEEAKTLVKKCMEQAASLSVPLVVECGHGKQWKEAH